MKYQEAMVQNIVEKFVEDILVVFCIILAED